MPAFLKELQTLSKYLTGTDPASGSTSILVPFLLLVIGIGGLIIALGLGTKQRVAGVWIDVRNRVSLARAQVTLWTVVALAGYAVFALFNIGFAGIVSSAADIAKYRSLSVDPGLHRRSAGYFGGLTHDLGANSSYQGGRGEGY